MYWFWSLLDQFWPFLKVFGNFKKSKMADPRWPPFDNKTLLWRHMTSSAEVTYLNGNIFGRTICPLSFVVIALIFSELRDGGGIRPPVPQDQKKPGLNTIRHPEYHTEYHTGTMLSSLIGKWFENIHQHTRASRWYCKETKANFQGDKVPFLLARRCPSIWFAVRGIWKVPSRGGWCMESSRSKKVAVACKFLPNKSYCQRCVVWCPGK